MIKDRKVLALEIIGTLFIIFLGTTLHFTFDFSGKNPIVGAFSAVNESVWEHLKLPFWPALLWLIIEIYPFRRIITNYFSAKTIGIIMMVVIIPTVFYAYTAFTEEILIIDITTFMIAVIVGQTISYKLYKKDKPPRRTETIAIIIIALLTLIFITFTFYPPHISIFQDSTTGQYGI